MAIKIKGTRSYIDIHLDDKVIRIDGEMIDGGFVAFANSMKNWTTPEEKALTKDEKNDIIAKINKKTEGSDFKIIFE